MFIERTSVSLDVYARRNPVRRTLSGRSVGALSMGWGIVVASVYLGSWRAAGATTPRRGREPPLLSICPLFHAALKRRALDAFTTRCILELSFKTPRSSHRPGVTPAPTAQLPAREEGSGDGELTGPAN